jgi:hypothetical protein
MRRWQQNSSDKKYTRSSAWMNSFLHRFSLEWEPEEHDCTNGIFGRVEKNEVLVVGFGKKKVSKNVHLF